MTEAEYIVADILLLNMPDHVAFSVIGFMGGNILIGIHDKYSPQLVQEIISIVQGRSDSVRKFLLREKYLQIINHTIPHDMMTDKGLKARELGGHKQYLQYEANLAAQAKEQEKKEFNISWPQRHWLLVGVIGFVFGILSPLAERLIEKRIWPESSQSKPPIVYKVDTVYLKADSSLPMVKPQRQK